MARRRRSVLEIQQEAEEGDDADLRTMLIEKIADPPFVQWLDKLSFCVGVVNLVIVTYIVAGYRKYFPLFYTQKCLSLFFIRYMFFSKKKQEYFMLELCYFVNILLLLYIWVIPDNKQFFTCIYCLAHGPLAFAIVFFKNALVFHSLDKITSCFIHISPLLCCWCVRWYGHEMQQFELSTFEFSEKTFAACTDLHEDCYNPWYTFVAPFILFFLHLGFSFIVPMPKDMAYSNTYRHLCHVDPATQKLFSLIPGHVSIAFTIFNSFFQLVAIGPTFFWFKKYYANFLYIVICLLFCLWRGATFYVEVFTRKCESSAAVACENAEKNRKMN